MDWNKPRSNIVCLAAGFLAFFCNGMKDSALGVMIPQLELHYDIDYFIVAIAFLAPFIGYMVAAATNDRLHSWIGRVGVLTLGSGLQVAFFVIASTAPPFPLFVVGYGLSGMGSGLIEASLNTFCGTLKSANQVLGLLHGTYGIGGIVCPTVAQIMVARGVPWQRVYTVLLGANATSMFFSFGAFFRDRRENYANMVGDEGRGKGDSFMSILKSGLVWLLALCVFLYVGGEVSTGGWTTTYMINVRNGNPDAMGYVSTGFWAGVAVGRIILGFASPYLARLDYMVMIYLLGTLAFSLVYWLVDHLMVSAISCGLIGLLIGPLFPTMMAVAVQKLPKWQHVSGLGFASAFGGGGAAALPFVCGALSQTFGPWAIAPLIFAAFSTMLAFWCLILKLY